MKQKINLGIVGCGNVSELYLNTLTNNPKINVIACADYFMEKAKKLSVRYNIPRVYKYKELIIDPEIDLVINLTPPQSHFELSMDALKNNKNIFSEKPLSINMLEASALLKEAKKRNLLIGSATDTYLGKVFQNVQEIIKKGLLGKIVGGYVFMKSNGPESWHPNPDFFYKIGSGPIYDRAVYPLAVCINLFGKVQQVVAFSSQAQKKRIITTKKRYGSKIMIHVPTHFSVMIKFKNNIVINLISSLDIRAANKDEEDNKFEIFGTNSSLVLPSPMSYTGDIKKWSSSKNKWLNHKQENIGYNFDSDKFRGIGVLEMVEDIIMKRKNTSSGNLAYHVLEVMQKIHFSALSNSPQKINSI